MRIRSMADLLAASADRGLSIGALMLEVEAAEPGATREKVLEAMALRIAVMREAMKRGLDEPLRSASGLTQGGAFRMSALIASQGAVVGGLFSKAIAAAIAVSEVNACMGRIVAAPTAGSCGVLPGALIVTADERGMSPEALVLAFMTAGAIGMAIERQATLAGAEGGCQAECGAASAMAAGGLVEMFGGSPSSAADAVAFALQNTMGLVCDPVAGLVEVPCVMRNAMATVNALACAEAALAGVKAVIPADEVIVAMGRVGRMLPEELRETGRGGIAASPTAMALKGSMP